VRGPRGVTEASRTPSAARPSRGAGIFLARKARVFQRALRDAEPRVLGNKDAEAVHDLRVALRRLRTLLKLARPIYGRFHADAVRKALAALQASTGTLRDEEALAETLDALGVSDPALTSWRMRRLARDKMLRRALVLRLQAGELKRAVVLLDALLTLPVHPDRDAPLGKLARKTAQSARRTVEAKQDAPLDDVVALHDLRIAYKQLRYAIEIFAEALPSDVAVLAEPAARFQKRLGELHDVDVALVSIQRARGLAPACRNAVLRALVVERQRKLGKYVAERMAAETVEAPVTRSPEKSFTT
jgi:CHAD domain-containing protein